MEHLLYVLWHDHWKPWIVQRLKDLAYIAVVVLIVAGAAAGMILTTIEVDKALHG